MDKAIRNILIVGGGSAGWMTAAYLSKALDIRKNNIQITLLESSDIDTIGVGEATIPMFGDFFKFLGIPEKEWMEKCNATFKLAIRFDGWSTGLSNDSYWHTFGSTSLNVGARISLIQHWLYRYLQGNNTSFAKACHESVQLCESMSAPKAAYGNTPSSIPYAFHLDAGLMVTLLKEFAISHGVNHLIDTITSVEVRKEVLIQKVITQSKQEFSADLYVDCSGFQSLLLGKALKEPWESDENSLFCDKAIAISTSYETNDPYNENHGGLKPYTSATALSHGWSWQTPLVGRQGNGYVYSSQFSSADEAEDTFRQFIQDEKNPAKHLNMKLGKTSRQWVGNCLAIGLSGGFIEPLESTGLALVQMGLNYFLHNFPDLDFSPTLQNNYNQLMRGQYENIRDFIILHYCLTKREDTPFWKAVKNDTIIPDSLKSKLEKWRTSLPSTNMESNRMFGAFNYSSILAGMDYLPKQSLPALEFVNKKQSEVHFERIKSKGEQLVSSLPNQATYFKQLQKIKSFKTMEW